MFRSFPLCCPLQIMIHNYVSKEQFNHITIALDAAFEIKVYPLDQFSKLCCDTLGLIQCYSQPEK